MTEYFNRMAQYNRWMNENLYALIETMPDDERTRDRGAFFRSVHGILNHLLLTDRAWLGRFTGVPFPVESLHQELYSDFSELRQERQKTDQQIIEWTAALTQDRLHSSLTVTSVSDSTTRTMLLWHAVQHLFNHQTHHRGQLTTLLDQLGYDYKVTDIARMPV